jgi:hypothetical protein
MRIQGVTLAGLVWAMYILMHQWELPWIDLEWIAAFDVAVLVSAWLALVYRAVPTQLLLVSVLAATWTRPKSTERMVVDSVAYTLVFAWTRRLVQAVPVLAMSSPLWMLLLMHEDPPLYTFID